MSEFYAFGRDTLPRIRVKRKYDAVHLGRPFGELEFDRELCAELFDYYIGADAEDAVGAGRSCRGR